MITQEKLNDLSLMEDGDWGELYQNPRQLIEGAEVWYDPITTSYHHKWNKTPNPEGVDPGFSMKPFFSAQWSDMPNNVADVIKKMWQDAELGNDHYILRQSIADMIEWMSYSEEMREPLKLLIAYIYQQYPDVKPDEELLFHYWW